MEASPAFHPSDRGLLARSHLQVESQCHMLGFLHHSLTHCLLLLPLLLLLLLLCDAGADRPANCIYVRQHCSSLSQSTTLASCIPLLPPSCDELTHSLSSPLLCSALR